MGVSQRRRVVRWAPAVLVAAGLVTVAGCGLQPPENVKRPTVSLRMQGSPPDAAVIIDDETVGQLEFVAAHGVALPPGVHHVTVKATGYFPWDHEVDAKEGSAPIRLQVALTPVPD
jgi:hypothetical protein